MSLKDFHFFKNEEVVVLFTPPLSYVGHSKDSSIRIRLQFWEEENKRRKTKLKFNRNENIMLLRSRKTNQNM